MSFCAIGRPSTGRFAVLVNDDPFIMLGARTDFGGYLIKNGIPALHDACSGTN
jgi:hypothetical protein